MDKQVLTSVPPSASRKNTLEELEVGISVRSTDGIEIARVMLRDIDGHPTTGSIVGDNERPHKRPRSSKPSSSDGEGADENQALRPDRGANHKRRRLLTEPTPYTSGKITLLLGHLKVL